MGAGPMPATAPAVTVVMSVFNGEAYLADAVESVLGQTWTDLELVAVDDGSTDGSWRILERCAREDSRVRLHRHANMGNARSRNEATALAAAPYIAPMDQDDVARPERLETQMRVIGAHPELALLGTALALLGAHGRYATHAFPTTGAEIRATLADPDVFSTTAFAHSTVVIRKDALQAVGGYRPALCPAEDYDLFHRLAERYPVANLGTASVLYRVHPGQVTGSHQRQLMLSVLAAHAAARVRRETGVDPLDGVQTITADVLETLGVGEAAVRDHLACCPPLRARQLIEAGYEVALR